MSEYDKDYTGMIRWLLWLSLLWVSPLIYHDSTLVVELHSIIYLYGATTDGTQDQCKNFRLYNYRGVLSHCALGPGFRLNLARDLAAF